MLTVSRLKMRNRKSRIITSTASRPPLRERKNPGVNSVPVKNEPITMRKRETVSAAFQSSQ